MPSQTQQPIEDDVRQRLGAGHLHEGFERLVELYSKKVFHLAFSMMGNQTQAEDLTQEIFLRIWKGLPGYQSGAYLSSWIYTIARNTCLTELKKRAARRTVSIQEPGFAAAIENLPSLHAVDREAGLEMEVHQMLNQLPDKYRLVIKLFYLEQRSYEEVSALLDMPLGTVKTLLYRAKKQLLQIHHRLEPACV